MHESCEDCSRVWGELQEATEAYLRLVSEYQTAAIRHDSVALMTLDRLIAEAAERRVKAVMVVKHHESAQHANEAAEGRRGAGNEV